MRFVTMLVTAVLSSTVALAEPRTVEVVIAQVREGTAMVPSMAAPIPEVRPGDVLKIRCPRRCDELTVVQGDRTLKARGVAAGEIWIAEAPVLADAPVIALGFGNKSFSLPVSTVTGDKAAAWPPELDTDENDGTIAATLHPACPSAAARNEIAVDTTGNVLMTNLDKFTEDDTLAVWVFGPEAVIDGLRVERRSAFRDVTVLRVQGDPTLVKGLEKQAKGPASVRIVCKRTYLANFSSGRGQFALVRPDGTALAQFEFAVRPIFDGMFTAAFIATWLPDRSFSLRPSGTSDMTSTIVEDPTGSAEGRFGLMYTAFLPVSKLSKNIDPGWNRRIGASVGVLLDDPAENFLFGLNVGPYNGLSFVVGGHFGKVTRLDGASVGDVVAADATLPTKEAWDTSWFVGASIDISVATRLLFAGLRQ